jgi:IS4 transposase
MRHQNTVFCNLLKFVPRTAFERIVAEQRGDYRVRRLSCWSQFVALLYGQLSGAQSLRELVASWASHGNLFYHLGAKKVQRSTLSDANRVRPAALFAAIFELLAPRLTRALAGEAHDLLRLIDSTFLRLNETLSGWARFCTGTTGVKLHVVYDPQAARPTYFTITRAKVNDIVEAKKMPITPGATYVYDLGYYDFAWWARLAAAGCRFVTRLKKNSPVREIAVRPVDGEVIVSDRVIRLSERMARNRKNPCQAELREIVVRIDAKKTLRLVTNDLTASAAEIAELYKTRWQIELFFKWVKQNLRLKKFLGTSENAVKVQIIVALIAFLLVRLAQHAWSPQLSLQNLARLIRANLLHRKSVPQIFDPSLLLPKPASDRQLDLDFAHPTS